LITPVVIPATRYFFFEARNAYGIVVRLYDDGEVVRLGKTPSIIHGDGCSSRATKIQRFEFTVEAFVIDSI